MFRTRFGKAGDATLGQHPAKFAQHLRRIGDVMKGVKADDAFDAAIGEIKPTAVKEKELWRGPLAHDRMASKQLLADLQSRRRHIARDDFTSQLRKNARRPTRPGAKLEHSHAGTKLQPL